MSVDATRWAWQQQGLRWTWKLVLLALADRADESGRCYPSEARLTRDTGMNRKTIIKAIASLEEEGLVTVDRRSGEVNVYQLNGVPWRENQSLKRDQSQIRDQSLKRDTTSPKLGTTTSPKLGTQNLSIEPNKKHKGARDPKPTPEELAAYCLARGGKVDPQAWWDHYSANGWRVGRNPMRDWRAAVRTWERRDFGETRRPTQPTFGEDM